MKSPKIAHSQLTRRAEQVVLALGHAAMLDAPVARPLERSRPQAGAAVAGRLLGIVIVAIGDRPALLDLPPVEFDAAGACRRRAAGRSGRAPSRSIRSGRSRPARPAPRGRAPAGDRCAPSLRQVWLYSGASMPRSRIRSPLSVMVSPSLTTASPEILPRFDAVEPGRDERQKQAGSRRPGRSREAARAGCAGGAEAASAEPRGRSETHRRKAPLIIRH